MAGASAPVTPAVLKWAREAAGYTTAEASHAIAVKEDRLLEWEAGAAKPTVGQLRNLARLYRRTPALFFLPEPPAPDLPVPPDFRGAQHQGNLSPTLRREMRRAVDRRRAFIALAGVSRNRFIELQVDLRRDADAAMAAREMLGVSLEMQFGSRDASAALALWIAAAEDAGALVFQMSRVDPAEVRGFSLYEADAPVIVLNGGDPPQARSFTLLHEVGHLLDRSGGVCDLWSNSTAERRCNRFAANVLMPAGAFVASMDDRDPVEQVYELASRFRVSAETAAIRLRELDRLTAAQVDEIREDTARRVADQKAREKEKEGGPAHHRTHLRNLGARYVGRVLEAVDDEDITLVDAAYLLDAKVSTIDRMSAELERRGAGGA